MKLINCDSTNKKCVPFEMLLFCLVQTATTPTQPMRLQWNSTMQQLPGSFRLCSCPCHQTWSAPDGVREEKGATETARERHNCLALAALAWSWSTPIKIKATTYSNWRTWPRSINIVMDNAPYSGLSCKSCMLCFQRSHHHWIGRHQTPLELGRIT